MPHSFMRPADFAETKLHLSAEKESVICDYVGNMNPHLEDLRLVVAGLPPYFTAFQPRP